MNHECRECGTEFARKSGMNSCCSVVCRFLEKVDLSTPDECWEWKGYIDPEGYGRFYLDGQSFKAHRACHVLFVGPIPKGLFIDHLCRNTRCVNPDHIEPVTPRENVMRGMAPSAVTNRTGVCQRGHSMDDAYIRPDGKRSCRVCFLARDRRYKRARMTSSK